MYANAVETLELSDNEIQKLKNNLYALPLDGRPVGLMQDPMPKLRSLRQMKMDDRIPKREDGAPDMEKLSRTKRCEEWRELLEDKPSDGRGWKLVILDPASRFIGPEVEKDNAAATQFIQILEDWKNNEDIKGDNDIGPTILISHHVSKSHNDTPIEMLYKQGAARGSSALTDGVRWQLNMNDGMVGEPNGDLSRYVVMSAPKQNDSEGQDGITWLQNKADSRFLKKLDNPPLGDLMGPSDIAEWEKENNETNGRNSSKDRDL
jgi:hypothetical protein